jgi:menaquinone-9 beta-reductase
VASLSNVRVTDVLIAGGGIAGSAVAILLARQGLRVEIFESGRFPREKPCGEGLMPAGVGVLERLGVAEAVGGEPFLGVRHHFSDQIAKGRFPEIGGLPAVGRGQRRRVLDSILFRAAASLPGVTAHVGARVDAPILKGGRVAGLMVEGQPFRARLVIAADGAHSRIRNFLGLSVPSRRKRVGIRTHFRLAPGKNQPPWVDVYFGRGYDLYVTPLPDGEVLVAGLADVKTVDEPLGRVFPRWLQSHPEMVARLEGAEQLTPLLGASPLAGRARCGVAPGVILLGDAAGFMDPITGGGMTQALLSAELLAKYTARSFADADAWLWKFEGHRRALLKDYRRLTQFVLWLAQHPRLAAHSLAFLKSFPALFSHLIGVSGGLRRLLPNRLCFARPEESLYF